MTGGSFPFRKKTVWICWGSITFSTEIWLSRSHSRWKIDFCPVPTAYYSVGFDSELQTDSDWKLQQRRRSAVSAPHLSVTIDRNVRFIASPLLDCAWGRFPTAWRPKGTCCWSFPFEDQSIRHHIGFLQSFVFWISFCPNNNNKSNTHILGFTNIVGALDINWCNNRSYTIIHI